MKVIQQFFIRAVLLIALFTAIDFSSYAQPTVLTAGDIAFSGYHSGGAQDSFSIVFLKPVNAGTVINFTDNSWLGAAFRSGETHFAYTTAAMPVGSEVTLALLSAGYVARWRQADGSFLSGGTISNTSGANPMALATLGDQVIAYQGTAIAPVFITAIHMNVVSTDATPTGDCGNTTALAWDPDCITASAQTCKLPLGLTTNQNCVWIGAEGRSLSEWDNARFSACGLDLSTPALMRAALNDSANWTLKSNGNITSPTQGPIFSLPATCPFSVQPNIIPAGSLLPFASCSGNASAEQFFSITGDYLTANVVITAPSGYEVSLSENSGYSGNGGSISLSPSSGSISSTTIYVRLASNASGSPTGNITFTSTDAITRTLAVSGIVTNTPSLPSISYSGSLSLCTGDNITLTSSNSLGNQWFLDGNIIIGSINPNYIASVSGIYTVQVTISGCSSPISIGSTVTVNSTPSTPTISAGGSTTITAGESVTLTSSSSTSNQWYKGGVLISGETNQTYSATTAGVYTVIVTTNGCSSSASAGTTITINPPATPTVSASGPTTFYEGGSVTFTASSTTGNQWYKDGVAISGATNQNYVATEAGVYTVISTIAGVSSAASAGETVTVNATPSITAGGPTTFDAGGSVTLSSSYTTGNQWYKDGIAISGATAQDYVATTAGVYTVIVTNGGSTSEASAGITVTLNAPATPTVSASGPTTFYEGGSVTFTASSTTGNQWYKDGVAISGATNQNYVATEAGVYTVISTIAGVSSAASAGETVTVNATPSITAGGPTTFDAGGSVTLSSSYTTGNQWYKDGVAISGATAQDYVATTAGVYTVIVTNGGSTSEASAGITVTLNAPATPTVSASGATTFCNGGSVLLTSDAVSGNQWYLNGNPIMGETNQTYTVTTSGNYHVIVTINGSSSAASTDVTVTVNPHVTSDTTASVCNQFTWHGTEYKASGDYIWVGTTEAGCDSTVTLHLTILSVTSTVTKTDASCFATATGSLTVNPTYGVAPFTYRIGTVASFVNTNTFTNLKAGKYTVTIVDAVGCSGITSQVTITQPLSLLATFTTTPTTCNGGKDGSLQVEGTRGNAPFSYRYGTTGAFSTTNRFDSIKAGAHKISVQDATGCVKIFSAIVPQPTRVSGTVTIINSTCKGIKDGMVTLTGAGGIPPYTYRWGTVGPFSNQNHFTNVDSGGYRLFVMDSKECFGFSLLAAVTYQSPFCSTRPTDNRIAANNTLQSNDVTASITPNPSNSQFVYRPVTASKLPIQLRVLDINGKVILSAKPAPGQPFRFGEQLPPGMYLVETKQGNEVKITKAIKIH